MAHGSNIRAGSGILSVRRETGPEEASALQVFKCAVVWSRQVRCRGRAGAEPSPCLQESEIKDAESTMRTRAGIVSLVVFGSLAVSIPLFAHHGNASFESKITTVTGTVTDYIWSNPHVWVKIDALDSTGKTAHWIVEAQNTVSMRAGGIT